MIRIILFLLNDLKLKNFCAFSKYFSCEIIQYLKISSIKKKFKHRYYEKMHQDLKDKN